MRIAAVLLFLAFFFPAPSSAWWDTTHGMLAEKVCKDFDCPCLENMTEWANIPDDVFHDTINHHDYNLSEDCPKSDLWKCPGKDDFRAGVKVGQYLQSAGEKEGCERWKDIAIASHYFFDTEVFWHNVQDESSSGCHSPFEKEVNEQFEKEKTGWTVCKCGACVSYDEFKPWVSEFEAKINFDEKVRDAPLFENEKSKGLFEIILGLLSGLFGWIF